MDKDVLLQIVEVAASCGAYVLCDEVYRGTNQEGDGYTASIADLYDKGISTASMSKTYSLAGLRLGWITAPTSFLKQVEIHRDYNTISVGVLDDYFATLALENRDKLLARNRKILKENLAILDAWLQKEPSISYVRPRSTTVCLLKYTHHISSRDFCLKLLESKGVMFTPGSAMDMEGYLRVGFANNQKALVQGLALVSEFLRELPQ